MFWVKGKDSPANELPQDTSSDLYVNIHSKALQERSAAALRTCPYDMVVLYQFWSHFLVRNFNTTMYNDFRSLALDDKERGNDTGLSNLIKFYEACFYSLKIQMRARVARHYVQLAAGAIGDGPAFDSLRKAWRDGAVPLRNRSIILRFIDHGLKIALDSVPTPHSSAAPSTATVH
jgi:la-related protein 1